MAVVITKSAQEQFEGLPLRMQIRIVALFERLVFWPAVSGAKPLRGDLAGHYRIRSGDWRILFQVVTPNVIVVRIAHRSTVYEE